MYLIFGNIELDLNSDKAFTIFWIRNLNNTVPPSYIIYHMGKYLHYWFQRKKYLFLRHIKTFFIKPIALHHYISFRVINQQAVLRKILFVVKYVYQATNSVELLDNVFVMLNAHWYKCIENWKQFITNYHNLGIYQLSMMIINYLKISNSVMNIISILY